MKLCESQHILHIWFSRKQDKYEGAKQTSNIYLHNFKYFDLSMNF